MWKTRNSSKQRPVLGFVFEEAPIIKQILVHTSWHISEKKKTTYNFSTMSTFLLLDKGPENQFAGWALLLAREALHPCCSPPGGSGSVHVMTPQGRRCSSARSSIWDCCQFCRRIWPMSLFSVFHIIAAIISLQWYKLLICHKKFKRLKTCANFYILRGSVFTTISESV